MERFQIKVKTHTNQSFCLMIFAKYHADTVTCALKFPSSISIIYLALQCDFIIWSTRNGIKMSCSPLYVTHSPPHLTSFITIFSFIKCWIFVSFNEQLPCAWFNCINASLFNPNLNLPFLKWPQDYNSPISFKNMASNWTTPHLVTFSSLNEFTKFQPILFTISSFLNVQYRALLLLQIHWLFSWIILLNLWYLAGISIILPNL